MIDLSAISAVQFWVFVQVFIRFASLVAIAPVFGSAQVPNQIKIWITLVLSAAVTPLVASTFPNKALPDNLYDLVATIVLQSLIGLIMGFVVTLIISAFRISGALIDLQIGFTMAETFNPEINDLASPISQFQYLYALLLFLLANGHHILLIALTRSFAILPTSALDLSSGPSLKMISDLTFGALVDGLMVAAPAGAILLVVDVAFAFLNRAMPQLNVFFVGMPVKVIAGLLILGMLLPATAMFAGQLVAGEPLMLSNLLHSMRRA